MNVLAYDLYPIQFCIWSVGHLCFWMNFIITEDIISLHCPLTEQTKYLINDSSISKMKDGVMIIKYGAWAVDSHQSFDRGTED